MRLWTFQYKEAVEELHQSGILTAKWSSYPSEGLSGRWKAAYQWMAKQMALKGINCGEYAPVWAFHSCITYRRKPDKTDGHMLSFGYAQEEGVRLLTVDCPDDLVLLTNYSVWNEILDVLVETEATAIEADLTKKLYTLPQAETMDGGNIQATIPFLKKEWVVETELFKDLAEDDL
ncbi:MAG TPA: hypothetical protein DCS93_15595 [Microscillaceae bacterium]|nr:hypothetical protein [Microscillaceae bacterium]